MSEPPLSDRALQRLFDVARPLGEDPQLGLLDTDRYEVRGELGSGGMGVVLDAFDRELEREVALKVLRHAAGLSSEARERFVREARAAARLNHPNIASVYDATPEAIAMQKIRGKSLADEVPSDRRELVQLLRDAALAIHYAHDKGIVHRDLKPANLMVERTSGDRPTVYVLDFGLAKELAAESSLSLSGGIVGTPAFLAPEQAAAETIDARTDVYGLGAVLYACLAGRPPFPGKDLVEVLRCVREEEPKSLVGVSHGGRRIERDLSWIVGRAMAKDPDRRYPTALALASDLERWLVGEPVEARPASVGYRLRRYLSRRQGIVGAALVAVLVSAFVALPLLWQARSRRLAAERDREEARGVLELSQQVDGALRDAEATLTAGVGYERGTHAILGRALERCSAFLQDNDVEHAHFLHGRLLRAQGRLDEALEAFERSAPLLEGTEALARERGLTLAALYRNHLPLLGEDPHAALETWRTRAEHDLAFALASPATATTPARLFVEAQLGWMRGEVETSIAKHREVLEMDRRHLGTHLSLAKLYLLAERDDWAMHHSIEATDMMRGAGRAYAVAAAGPAGESLRTARLDYELVSFEGIDELLIDFDLLLQRDPGDASSFGMRGQVQLREALRAIERGDDRVAQSTLELAVRQFHAVVTLQPDGTPGIVGRAVVRSVLGRLHARLGRPAEASESLAAAARDYDAAVEREPNWAFVRYNRALLAVFRSDLARLARRGDEARALDRAAREDARLAAVAAGPRHPWAQRFAELLKREER